MSLEIRIHGNPPAPTLVYLPGLHGDWTLVASFRLAIASRVRLVEIVYPRTLSWSLDDHAAAIEEALRERGIVTGWLLGESFGSQVLWAMLQREKAAADASLAFRTQGVILAGGFVRHPVRWGARLARACGECAPDWLLNGGLRLYSRYAKFRHRQAPETLANIHEFVRRRQEPHDRAAIQHRLMLVAGNDPRPIARQVRLPVYALAGLVDPIVPVPPVRRWLRRECPGFRGARLICNADHNVLGTAPQKSAEQILKWLDESRNDTTAR